MSIVNNATADLERRRAANDAFRSDLIAGAVMFSACTLALGASAQQKVLEAVRRIAEFDDDVEDDHAIGDVEVEAQVGDEPSIKLLVFFRIVTTRLSDRPTQLLSITLADEWWGADAIQMTELPDAIEAEPPITEVDDCTDPPVNNTATPISVPNDEFQNAQRDGAKLYAQGNDVKAGEATASEKSDAEADDTSEKIRQLNDALRRTFQGGTVLITAGIAALDAATQARVIAAVQSFDQFTEDNDPWGEHDMGALEVDSHRIFFKLDYYDLTRSMLAEDPCDPTTTERVLTIMLAEEY